MTERYILIVKGKVSIKSKIPFAITLSNLEIDNL